MPLLTVMIPAHNAEETLSAAIQSILYQTFTDFELWVLENGSIDHTLELAQTFNDPRLKLFNLGKVGFQGAMQWGLEKATTKYIARMDADDICLPNRFEVQINHLQNHPEHVLHGCHPLLLTPNNHILEKTDQHLESGEVSFMFMSDILGEPKRYFADPSVMFRREIAIQVGGYDDEFNVGDVSLWIRMLKNHVGYQTTEPLLVYRLVNKSMSNTLTFNQQTRACRIKYYGERYSAIDTTINKTQDTETAYWIRVANMELLAGQTKAYQLALQTTGINNSLLTRVKANMQRSYSLFHRHRYGVKYRRMFAIEDMLKPML